MEGLGPAPQSLDVAFDLHDAMVAFNERETFGPPTSSGTGALAVWWMEAIVCVLHAKRAAEDELREAKQGFAGNDFEVRKSGLLGSEDFRDS